MALPNRFRIVQGATDVTLARPAQPWVPGSRGVGGTEFSAARVPSNFEVRRDHTLAVTLRMTWAEWGTLRPVLEAAQRGTLTTIYPDAADAASRACYLLQPAMGEALQPRHGAYPGDYEIDLVWVDSTDTGWDAFGYYG